ncbi:MAG: tetratricopeptide repeat protein [Limisphaerales bacterium]
MSAEQPQPTETKRAKRESDIYDLLAWLEANRMKVLAAFIVLTLIGFAIATMRHMREQKELQASGQLLALRATLTANTNIPPVAATAFAKVAQDFSGTAAAERARILAASTLFTEGKYAEAETAFKAFQNDFANSQWRSIAAYGVATAQEAQNKPEAVAAYQNVATSFSKSAVADDAKLALARIHEQKNEPAEALRIYNEILAPRSGALQMEAPNRTATDRKDALLRAHPELNVTTNTAPAMTELPSALPTAGAPNDTLQIPAPRTVTNSAPE